MSTNLGARKYLCARCGRSYTSWKRLQHHWAADYGIRTSADILRTSQIMARTRSRVARVPQVSPSQKMEATAAPAARSR